MDRDNHLLQEKLNIIYDYAELLISGKQLGRGILGDTEEEKIENVLYLLKFLYRDTLHIPYKRARKDTKLLRDLKLYWTVNNLHLARVLQEDKQKTKLETLMDLVYAYEDL